MALWLKAQQYRWPGPVIAYTVNPNFTEPVRVGQAIAHWEEKTQIRFVARYRQRDYIEFSHGVKCSSKVGRRGRRQLINLTIDCKAESVKHEISHAIGLKHERQRPDRSS
jgi:hypothetical protein